MTILYTEELTAQDISSAAQVAEYVADGDYQILAELCLSGLAGGGTYRACLTKQVGGAGAVFQSATTGIAVAAGATTAYLPTGPLLVDDDDTIGVYAVGLAGDTAANIMTRIYDATSPNLEQFYERSLPSADYTVVSDLPAAAPSAADIKTALEADGSKLDHLWEMTEDDGGVRRLTANALKEAPTGGGDAPTVTQIRQEMDANSTKLADILTDTGTTLPGLLAGIGSGSGAGTYTDTVTDGVNPVDGVRVVLYTDSALTHAVYQAYTNALGVFTMHPDLGTYYRQVELAGYTGTQGVQVVVA